MLSYKPIINQIEYNGYRIGILRLDLIDSEISGNKWFKLKYNLQEAQNQHKSSIVTFGGAFSNHIAATAAACCRANIKSIGLIRGESDSSNNPTLFLAQKQGMELHFISRQEYKQKNEVQFLEKIKQHFPNCYIIPEGGDNELGAKGCEEILTTETDSYKTIFCAYGTGTTFSGIAKSLNNNQFLYAVNVLKFDATSNLPQSTILNEYHFGGYAKHTNELLQFKSWFENTYSIPLDYVYTAKSFYAAFDLMKHQKLNTEKHVLIIHCGGLQGNKGYEDRYNLQSKS